MAKPSFQGITVSGENINLTWSAISGRSYKVQFKNNLNEINWTDLATIVATGNSATRSESVGTGQRYYRIIALE